MAIKFRPTGAYQLGQNLKSVPGDKLNKKVVKFFKKVGAASIYDVKKKYLPEKFAKKYQSQVVKIERDEMRLNEKEREAVNKTVFNIATGPTKEQQEAKIERGRRVSRMFSNMRDWRARATGMRSGGRGADVREKIRQPHLGPVARASAIQPAGQHGDLSGREGSAHGVAGGTSSSIAGAGARGVAGEHQAVGIGGIGGQEAKAMTEKGDHRFAVERTEKGEKGVEGKEGEDEPTEMPPAA